MKSSAFLLLMCLAAAPAALACSCLEPPPPAEAMALATTVFVGTVVNHSEKGRQSTYEFAVSETFKGAVQEKMVVRSATDSATCGYNFTVGERYLVYAFGKDERLSTNLCTRTRSANGSEAEDELVALRAAAKADKGQKEAPPPRR